MGWCCWGRGGFGRYEELYIGGPSRLLSLPEAAEQLSAAERSGGLAVLLRGQSREGGDPGGPMSYPTQRLLKVLFEEERRGRGRHGVGENEVLPIEGEILRYRGIRFGGART